MPKSKYLCVMFVVSSGQNEENLGSDESEIINLSTIIIDVSKCQAVDTCQFFVKPENHPHKLDFLSVECQNLTQFNESLIENACGLEEAIYEFEQRLLQKKLHPSQLDVSSSDEDQFVFLVDGPLHLRQALVAECAKKSIRLPKYFYKYFDLRKEFKKYLNVPKITNLKDILNYIYIEQNSQLNYSLNQCEIIEKIVYKMLKDGHVFETPISITQELPQGICSLEENVEDNSIARVRGVPWQCSEHDIFSFFSGLNIAEGGVAMCLSAQGRRNGEALVRFENEEQRELGLRRHKHHIGNRYIEVYRASAKDFLNIAGGLVYS